MPLPKNGSISLQGHSRPGEGTTTKPKIAMVVRMTEDALDALQNVMSTDRMEFEFGDKPGIFVRDHFFPMRYGPERTNQELFIRTTTAQRPSAPLRLNANVVGKFQVERKLTDKDAQRVHNASAAAAKQKAERKTQAIDTLPDDTPLIQITKAAAKPPKKRAPPKSTPKSTPIIVTKNYATTAQSSSNGVGSSRSSALASLPKEMVTHYREKIIHFLAMGPYLLADLVKKVGTVEADAKTTSGIKELIYELAEPEQLAKKATTSQDEVKWQLKPQSWREVRPYEYQGYTETWRTKVARSARTWLKNLKVPETDPAWSHVKFRESGTTTANLGAKPTNGISSIAAKGKAAATKANGSRVGKETEIAARNETPPPRRYPGSVPVSSKPDLLPPSRSTPPVRISKEKEVDSEKEEGELSASQTPPRTIPKPTRSMRPPSSRLDGMPPPSMPPPPLPSPSNPTSSTFQGMSTAQKRPGAASVDMRNANRLEPPERVRNMPISNSTSVTSDRKPIVVQAQAKKDLASPLGRESRNGSTPSVGGSNSLTKKERGAQRTEKERGSDRESIRNGGYKRESTFESDRESVSRKRERDSYDKESAREREREREREKLKKERERELLERGRERERGREKEKVKTKEKGRAQNKSSSSTLVNSSKGVTKSKLKPDEYPTSGGESSDWGFEERREEKKKKKRSETSSTIGTTSTNTPTDNGKGKTKRDYDATKPGISGKSLISASTKTGATTITVVKTKITKVPRKEVVGSEKKIKREISPVPTSTSNTGKTKMVPSAQKLVASANSSNSGSGLSSQRSSKALKESRGGSSSSGPPKKRKRSFEYTSSSEEGEEEEEEEERPKAKVLKISKKATPHNATGSSAVEDLRSKGGVNSNGRLSQQKQPTSSTTNSMSIASKVQKMSRKEMRARHSEIIPQYMSTYAELMTVKAKVDQMQARVKDEGIKLSDISDEEFFWDVEDLKDTKERYMKLHEEVEEIQKRFE